MRRLLLVSLTASLLVGCGVSPTTRPLASMQHVATAPMDAATQPFVSLITGFAGPAPVVSVLASLKATPGALALSQAAAAKMVASDSELESVDLLINDGGAYFVQGWFTDLKDAIVRTWTRWKLSREVKAALKNSHDKAFSLHEGEIDNIRKNRTAPVTKINDLGGGNKEVVTTWKSTNHGTYNVETRRIVDAEGVTQVLSVATTGKDKDGHGIETVRVRTLVGTDGTYKVATKQKTTYKDGRQEYQEWLKQVATDGSEKIAGFINHPDGNRTDITGTRDAKGKVLVEVSKIAPWHNASPAPTASPASAAKS
jgi:hypothetical protein